MTQQKISFTFKLLRALGFKYPIEDYGDVSLWKVIKQLLLAKFGG